ncbi:peptidase E [Priestia koreensis]|uniref:Peptidase n=1 Tax=Priestia koreensis TaxID=284581 RepID=A0A0M0L9Y5_9BACI|nr:peptidase E [Priestia koreensis]KOO47662.1 peptidase [Priestia koreensis]
MRQIIALGGGGFSMEPENLLLDQYLVSQVNKKQPNICFIPTASGDSESYIERFYEAYKKLSATPTHLSLFSPNWGESLESFILQQDIIYVGGGSSRNLLTLWKEWGLDHLLLKAYEQGIVLAGISAGGICWFQEGVTDSGGPTYREISALGILQGSFCPHYEGDEKRRPAYHELLQEQRITEGYGVDDSVALHFIDEQLHQAISSVDGKRAFYVKKQDEKVEENSIQPLFLGDS